MMVKRLSMLMYGTTMISMLLCCIICGTACTTANKTLTLGYTIPWNQGWLVGRQIGSAILVGIDEVNHRQLLPMYDIKWVLRDTYCEPKRGMAMAVDIWASVDDLDGIIGDGCSVVCQPVSLLAAAWGIPVISWGCASASLSDKHIYPTFTRVEGTWLSLGPVFDSLASALNWSRVGILTTPQDIFKMTAEAIQTEMERHDKEIVLHVVDTTIHGETVVHTSLQALRQTMLNMKEKVRIFYLMGYPHDLRNMLITAHEEGMFNGQFVFVAFEFSVDLGASWAYRPELTDDIVYENLIVVGLHKPSGPKYESFLHAVIRAFQDPVFDNWQHIPPTTDINNIDVYAGETILFPLGFSLFILFFLIFLDLKKKSLCTNQSSLLVQYHFYS